MKMPIYLLTFLFVPILLFGQKKFEATFILPDSTIAKDISFYHWDCYKRGWSRDTATIRGNKATIAQSYNTVNAEVLAEYQSGESWYSMKLVLTGKPATVKIAAPLHEKDIFNNAQLVNALDLKKEDAVADEYIQQDLDTYKQRYEVVGSDPKLYTDSAEIEKLKALRTTYQKKRLEYITNHSDAYSAFSLFTREAIYELPPDYLLQQFATIFPANFRESEQGAFIKKYLLEREGLEVKKQAPNFTENDLDNKPVSLEDYKGKKTVLVVFWATWCVPCVEEIPMLKALKEKYPKEKFEIISVSAQSKEEKVREMVKEKGMDWVQIFSMQKLCDLYHVKWFPTMCVIDPKGNFAYSSPTVLDASLEKMKNAIAESVSMN